MAWPLQGAPWEKLNTVVEHLIWCFTVQQALEDGKHDIRHVATDEDHLKAAAEDYGISNIEIYELLKKISPIAADRLDLYYKVLNKIIAEEDAVHLEQEHLADSHIPQYDSINKCWKVSIDGRTEYGDLIYVAGEYIRDSLYYPYSAGTSEHAHAHSFDGVLKSLLHDPRTFSVKGHEEYYSRQELMFLDKIQAKLQQPDPGGCRSDVSYDTHGLA